MSVTPARRALTALALLWLSAFAALAHNPDTSYARIAIHRDRIEVRLLYDLFTLQRIANVDADRDGRASRAELTAIAPEIDRFLRSRVHFEIDGTARTLGGEARYEWPRDAADAIASADWHTAAALIAFPFTIPLEKLAREVSVAFRFFDAFGSRHTVLGAFEYGGGTEEVTFTEEEPDYLFDTAFADGVPATETAAPREEPSVWSHLRRFVRLGVEHIFLGYDHICFLIALLVVSRFRELVKIVTSFTVAHSITLVLAALGIARLPSRLVECAIALTIVYVAAENLWRTRIAHRWKLIFAFGLVHGFGFAGVLSELGLPTTGRVRCLLAFNVGVEIGQLVIVALAFPLILLLARWRYSTSIISSAVGLFGLGWFLDRSLGLSLMPL